MHKEWGILKIGADLGQSPMELILRTTCSEGITQYKTPAIKLFIKKNSIDIWWLSSRFHGEIL
jgi:hypothetical protein